MIQLHTKNVGGCFGRMDNASLASSTNSRWASNARVYEGQSASVSYSLGSMFNLAACFSSQTTLCRRAIQGVFVSQGANLSGQWLSAGGLCMIIYFVHASYDRMESLWSSPFMLAAMEYPRSLEGRNETSQTAAVTFACSVLNILSPCLPCPRTMLSKVILRTSIYLQELLR